MEGVAKAGPYEIGSMHFGFTIHAFPWQESAGFSFAARAIGIPIKS
jgi:hypothetical protein